MGRLKEKEKEKIKIREENRLKQRLFRAKDKENNIARMYLRMPEPIMAWARCQAATKNTTVSEFVMGVLLKLKAEGEAQNKEESRSGRPR